MAPKVAPLQIFLNSSDLNHSIEKHLLHLWFTRFWGPVKNHGGPVKFVIHRWNTDETTYENQWDCTQNERAHRWTKADTIKQHMNLSELTVSLVFIHCLVVSASFLLWAAPFCVQSPVGCPILCTISYGLPHNLLCIALFCVLSAMCCLILYTIFYGLPHIVYNFLWAAPFCVQSLMCCPILCTISYVLPHFVYKLIDFHRFSHLFLYMVFPVWHIPGLEIPWNCSLVPRTSESHT